jgi:hypothetical protein
MRELPPADLAHFQQVISGQDGHEGARLLYIVKISGRGPAQSG